MRSCAALAAILAGLAACPGPPEPRGIPRDQALEARREAARGLALLEQEKASGAVEAFQRVVELAPAEPLGHVNLAIAWLRLEDAEKARTEARRAIEVAPDHPGGYRALALVLDWEGRDAEADDARRRALERDPDDPRVRYAHARYLLQKGETAAAVEQLRELRLRAPANVVVLSDLAVALIEAGRAEEAAGPLEAVAAQVDAHGDTAGVLRDAMAAARAGERDRALRLARVATNLMRGREIYRLSSGQVRSGVVGLPMEELATAELRSIEPDPPPGTEVRYVRVEQPPGSTAQPSAWLGADGGPRIAVDLDGEGPPQEIWIQGGAIHVLPSGPTGGDARRAFLTQAAGADRAGLSSLLAADLDHDGDLDLFATSVQGPPLLLRNDGDGTWIDATAGSGLEELGPGTRDATFADLDGDTDLDLAVAGRPWAIAWNQRLGRFRVEKMGGDASAAAVAAGDLTGDGCIDLVVVEEAPRLLTNDCRGAFTSSPLPGPAGEPHVFDHDNDGFADLLLWGAEGGEGRAALLRGGPGGLALTEGRLPAEVFPGRVHPADLDGDGDLDLVHEIGWGEDLRTTWLRNDGGNDLAWLDVRLEPLEESSDKNPPDGIGARVEVRAGDRLQAATVRAAATHFGLGESESADILRVVWPNGVPQSRLEVAGRAEVAERELLKGSCPFLFAWDGEGFAFVTDLLWASPLGLPLPVPETADRRPIRAGWDPDERVRIALRHTGGHMQPRDGRYELRITEELWETAYFELVRLMAVDHPEGIHVYSNLKIQPPPYPDDDLRAARGTRPPAMARGDGRDVLGLLAAEDARFFAGGRATSMQGIRTPWELVLSPPAGRPDVLLLTGWIFPTDASLNVGLSQRRDPGVRPPVLEYEAEAGRWRPLPGLSAYPPGKTKTIYLELPPEARGRRLRITSNLDIRWDAAAFADRVPAALTLRETSMAPARAELRWRGFSAAWRESAEGPHLFDYERVSGEPRWVPVEGPFTRYGDVRELLAEVDDRMVVMGPGDEIVLFFDADALPDLPSGWTRTFFLESHGWDKDADLNTLEGHHAEPYPCRKMTTYPPRPDECPPQERLDWLQLQSRGRPSG